MSEQPAAEVTATVPTPAEITVTPQTSTEPEATPSVKPTETVEFWKTQAREQERRAKANASAATRLQEIEDAQKTAEQRAADQAAATQRERDEARAESLRYKAAIKHKLPEDALDLLGSGDEDTIEARAERLGAYAGAAAERDALKADVERLTAENEALRQGKPVPLTGRPLTALQPGATPSVAPVVTDDAYPAHWVRNSAGSLTG